MFEDSKDNSIGNNIDLNMLKQLVGGFGGGSLDNNSDFDAMGMMNRIQKLQKIMGNNQNTENYSDDKNNKEESEMLHSKENRMEQMLYTALPFIQQPFRNMIFNMTKFMEVQRIMSRKEEDILLNARERGENVDEKKSSVDMLQAIKPFLHKNEQQQLDMMVKMMGIGSMLNGFAQNNVEEVDK